MIRFSANLTMLFSDVDFLDRFERAAKAGFKAVEYMFPYTYPKEKLTERLQKYGLQQVLFNLPAGDWAAGDRGLACLPGREEEFRNGVGLAIEYAKALGCPLVNCLVGKTPAGAPEEARRTLKDNLRFAASALEKEKIRFLFEPLNIRDMPGFYLCGTGSALKLIEEVNHPNLWLQYDIYHMQVTEGNLMQTIQENFKRIAHIQIADNPGRNEPGTGEINFPNIFRFLDKIGYSGWIGCEYKPLGKTEEGLVWMKPYR
ncbi:MAG: hydroxypyruvate isomerase [Deltaproteobacteria bacterium]|nr:hydroxypyruvate isomerase [Deltaproteobacteria bacterium]